MLHRTKLKPRGGRKSIQQPSSCLEEKSSQLRQSCAQFPHHPSSDTFVWPKWNHRKLPWKEKSSATRPLSSRNLVERGSRLRKLLNLLNQTTRIRNKAHVVLFVMGRDHWVIFFLGKSLIHFNGDLFPAQYSPSGLHL